MILALASVGAGAAFAVSVSVAMAQPARLQQRLGPTPSRMHEPVVGRYEVTEGADFTLDRAGPPPLLRFETSSEVWVLRPTPGPRGDIIYRNDVGRQFLRAPKVGGMTLFTLERPAGSAAAYTGTAPSMRVLAPIGPGALFQRAIRASARASRYAQHIIEMQTEADPESAPLMADTADVAAEAIQRLSILPNGRRYTNRIASVSIVEGVAPGVRLAGSELIITIVPSLGYSGRPSSDRMIAAIMH